jgi:hypothetical protein
VYGPIRPGVQRYAAVGHAEFSLIVAVDRRKSPLRTREATTAESG